MPVRREGPPEADTCKQYLTKAQADAADKQMDAALPMPPAATAEKAEPAATRPRRRRRHPPPRRRRPPDDPRPVKKQKEAPKRSGDPCMKAANSKARLAGQRSTAEGRCEG